MSDQFEASVARVKELSEDPGNDVKLKLYALYKQATEGDVQGKRPGFTNPVGRAKYDAWAALVGLTQDEAKVQYSEIADAL
ncbi:MAG: acyl-CoA-binding protein [Candidatus Nanopelagicales bacterium]|jgi:acyl-CoA-binding protein|nr:acyl-CoA-binding protein [Candidatus Nanopelagicales bacterium]MCU0294670.1 acyl-CoA-binding protein [Candidatus Nanopelagicales bacterium]